MARPLGEKLEGASVDYYNGKSTRKERSEHDRRKKGYYHAVVGERGAD